MNSGLTKLSALIASSLLIVSLSSPLAIAKSPKACGKDSSRILCSDGSPNSDIFKLIKRNMPRTANLKKSSTATQIRSSICRDSENSTGPQVDSAVQYMFAWHEWRVSGLTYKSIMQNYYYGDWDKFCSLAKGSNSDVNVVETFTVPNFVGSSQAMVENWKRRNGLKVTIFYSTAIGYNYLVSCQVQEKGIVLAQQPFAGSRMVNAFGNTIWLDIDC